MDVYRKLQKHLDQMPVAFPETKSGVEIRLLKQLFTEQEAEVALELSAIPEPVEKIHKRLSPSVHSIESVAAILDNLSKKGAIINKIRKQGAEKINLYGKIPLAIGMFEFQVNRITREFASDFYEYEDEAFADAMLDNETKQMRTIPVNASIRPEFIVGNYDNATELIKSSKGPFAVMNCVCRQSKDQLGEPCKQTDLRETCITLESSAKYMMHRGVGTEMTKQETLKLLTRAKKEGMVLQPENTQHPGFICCCCGCCCGVLHAAKKYEKPTEFIHSNYFAQVDTQKCEACGDCQDRCQLDAIIQMNGYMEVNEDRCIGCGVCIPVCPTKALSLRVKEKIYVPPKAKDQMYRRMLLERFGVLGTIKFAFKAMTGQKV